MEAWAFDGLIYPPIVRGFSGLALGIWLNDLQTEYNNLMSKWTIVVCNAISCILVICLLSGIESYGIVILGFCGIVLSCFYPYKATEWKINKCILAIGRWCYGAYLFHISAIKIVAVALRVAVKTESAWPNLVCSIVAAFAMAVATEWFIKMMKQLYRKISKRRYEE